MPRKTKKTGLAFKTTWFVSTGLSTKDGVLTNAGALFADDCPIPQSRLFCTVWNGLTKSKDSGNDKEFSENLIELLDTARLEECRLGPPQPDTRGPLRPDGLHGAQRQRFRADSRRLRERSAQSPRAQAGIFLVERLLPGGVAESELRRGVRDIPTS